MSLIGDEKNARNNIQSFCKHVKRSIATQLLFTCSTLLLKFQLVISNTSRYDRDISAIKPRIEICNATQISVDVITFRIDSVRIKIIDAYTYRSKKRSPWPFSTTFRTFSVFSGLLVYFVKSEGYAFIRERATA